MARSYDARVIALTTGQTLKWVDNLLSHHQFPGVIQGRQGVQRRISDDGLLAIEMARMLTMDLGVPLARAAVLVRGAIASRDAREIRVAVGVGLTVVFELDAIERRLRERVTEALESVARVPRGRPPLAPRSTSQGERA